jgi:hypothetical protein
MVASSGTCAQLIVKEWIGMPSLIQVFDRHPNNSLIRTAFIVIMSNLAHTVRLDS